jgi:hypothetical protein
MSLNRVLSLVLLAISGSLSGCLTHPMDARFNPWLGKTKDVRVNVIGPPDTCTVLNTGAEVCEWVSNGVASASLNCPVDLIHKEPDCRGGVGESWEHHVLYTYDRDGIATAWNYRGSSGQRSSGGSQVLPAVKEAKLGDDLSEGKTEIQDLPAKTTPARMN